MSQDLDREGRLFFACLSVCLSQNDRKAVFQTSINWLFCVKVQSKKPGAWLRLLTGWRIYSLFFFIPRIQQSASLAFYSVLQSIKSIHVWNARNVQAAGSVASIYVMLQLIQQCRNYTSGPSTIISNGLSRAQHWLPLFQWFGLSDFSDRRDIFTVTPLRKG